jgi:aryl-alcohol dehydrogenase-like predicted oxidoreductase
MNLGLGTAQFGMRYGVTNKDGRTGEAEVQRILDVCRRSSVTLIDTACLYGESESILGRLVPANNDYRIVTKTAQIGRSRIRKEDVASIASSIDDSFRRLRRRRIYGLLVHSAADLFAVGGERLFELVYTAKEDGRAAKIGVSVYSPEQAHELVNRYSVDLVQFPLSLLDQRMVSTGVLAELAAKGIEMHVRSAFLQGVIVEEPQAIPDSLAKLRPHVERIRAAAKEAGMTPAGLALGYLSKFAEVERIIVGVNTLAQLKANLAACQEAVPDGLDFPGFGCTDEELIDPRRWRI